MRPFHHVGQYLASIRNRDNWQMAAAMKLLSLPLAEVQKYQSPEIGARHLVTAISQISHLSKTDRQYQNRPRMTTRGQHKHS
jgi:hypothetical protein